MRLPQTFMKLFAKQVDDGDDGDEWFSWNDLPQKTSGFISSLDHCH